MEVCSSGASLSQAPDQWVPTQHRPTLMAYRRGHQGRWQVWVACWVVQPSPKEDGVNEMYAIN